MKYFFAYILLLLSLITYAQPYGLGLSLDDEGYNDIKLKPQNLSFFDDFADVKRASLKAFTPTVKNQSTYGTCTGWSSTYYGRTILDAYQNNVTNKEEISEFAYSPIFTYLNAAPAENKINCNKGAQIGKALESLKNLGAPLLSEYGENIFCDDYIPEQAFEKAKRRTIKEYRRLSNHDDTPEQIIENVKRAIYKGNPVIIGFKIENEFYTAKGQYIPKENDQLSGYHAMCVVGFDDEKNGGAFEIVNSWGTQWGNDGYLWINYKDFSNYTFYAVEMIPHPKPVEDEYKTLAGELRLELSNRQNMQVTREGASYNNSVLGFQDVVEDTEDISLGDYKTNTAYPINTKYRIYAKANQPAYVYVFGADNIHESTLLFPHISSISPYLIEKESELVMPGEKYLFRLNEDVPSDYTIVVYSLKELDPYEIKQKLDTLEGELTDKLYVIFGKELIGKDNITLVDNQMKFEARFKQGSIAVLVLDIKRS